MTIYYCPVIFFAWPRRIVGQACSLRRIANPPAALGRARRDRGASPPLVAACRYVGQVFRGTSGSGGLASACPLDAPAATRHALRLCRLVGQAVPPA